MSAAAGPGLEELILLETLLGLKKGNKYGVREERKIPVLQTNNGSSLTGLTTIATHLVKQAKKEQLLGSTAEEKAIVQQWLEYRVTQVAGHSNKEDIRIILKIKRQLFFNLTITRFPRCCRRNCLTFGYQSTILCLQIRILTYTLKTKSTLPETTLP
ncbi:eukaryotic translation elongation factor 1 epsilon-1 isoform X2 [Eretmochelys imbricata]